MKILLVEDQKTLTKILKKGLEEFGYIVDISLDGEEGLYMATEFEYDAIVLDISLPKMDGLSLLSILREKGKQVPVLMLTAKSEISDKILGLNSGADDYLTKPFDFTELLARLNSLIRRSKGKSSPLIKINDLEININSKTVKRENKDIKLSANEYNILEYMVLNHGKVISRTEFIEHLYSMDSEMDSNVIDVYINFLRNKIDKNFKLPLIHTIRGQGYILEDKFHNDI